MNSLESLVQRLESAVKRLEQCNLNSNSSKSNSNGDQTSITNIQTSGEACKSVTEYNEYIESTVIPWLNLSKEIGDVVAEQGKLVHQTFRAQSKFLDIVSKSKKPIDNAVFTKLIKETADFLTEISQLKEKNRTSKLFSHLSTVAEGISGFGWVCVDQKPVPFVTEMKDAAMFYANRVVKEYKQTDKKHCDWATKYVEMLSWLSNFVKQYHTTGLAWNQQSGVEDPLQLLLNNNNINTKNTQSSSNDKSLMNNQPGSTSSSSGGVPPPPLPPPPPPAPAPASVNVSNNNKPSVDPSALLAQLNQGESVTANLKKVDKTQMTHKNPELRKTGAVKIESTATTKANNNEKKVGTTNLDGNKWTIENHCNVKEPIKLDDVNMKQTVYIFGCKNSYINIPGKVNTVTLDNCSKVGLVLHSAVSSCDIINCKSVEVQIVDRLPTISVDKTDGVQIYLSETSADTEILSAKSSELNISILSNNGANDPVEFAIAEQMITVIKKDDATKKYLVKTSTVEHKG